MKFKSYIYRAGILLLNHFKFKQDNWLAILWLWENMKFSSSSGISHAAKYTSVSLALKFF